MNKTIEQNILQLEKEKISLLFQMKELEIKELKLGLAMTGEGNPSSVIESLKTSSADIAAIIPKKEEPHLFIKVGNKKVVSGLRFAIKNVITKGKQNKIKLFIDHKDEKIQSESIHLINAEMDTGKSERQYRFNITLDDDKVKSSGLIRNALKATANKLKNNNEEIVKEYVAEVEFIYNKCKNEKGDIQNTWGISKVHLTEPSKSKESKTSASLQGKDLPRANRQIIFTRDDLTQDPMLQVVLRSKHNPFIAGQIVGRIAEMAMSKVYPDFNWLNRDKERNGVDFAHNHEHHEVKGVGKMSGGLMINEKHFADPRHLADVYHLFHVDMKKDSAVVEYIGHISKKDVLSKKSTGNCELLSNLNKPSYAFGQENLIHDVLKKEVN